MQIIINNKIVYNFIMTTSHVLGFPRLGPDREYKKALESYWNGKIDANKLEELGAEIRRQNWRAQENAGLSFVTVGDFAWYDHILNVSAMINAVPARFTYSSPVDINTVFRMARGRAPVGKDAHACEMTKWFDTNYHYIVPELQAEQQFALTYCPLFEHIKEAQQQGHSVKVVLPGPVSYLWLSKCVGAEFDKLSLLDGVVAVYEEVLAKVKDMDVEWVQIDEPILTLDLPDDWRAAYATAYKRLSAKSPKIMLTTYFSGMEENFAAVKDLPVAGLHFDAVRSDEWQQLASQLPQDKVLSLGVINGRDVWRANLQRVADTLKQASSLRPSGSELWVGSSCSLMHSPVDLTTETNLDDELKQWLAFATQKCQEVALLAKVLDDDLNAEDQQALAASTAAAEEHKVSGRIHKQEVAARVAAINADMEKRASPFTQRAAAQKEHINLPAFPTTTIGSFPQTSEIRVLRGKFKRGEINEESYVAAMKKEIAQTVAKQEEIGLDVLVHGEPERNDMVEYFGELLDGVAVTSNGWVQSYGSRCVKPPIIYGDVSRPTAMTVPWSAYAKEVTDKPMKAMLTGPVTILCWSFVRDDISRAAVARQIALTLRDEAVDLEKAGMQMIQIDEPALREGLPLRRRNWQEYLDWAVEVFRLSSCGVRDETQIHSHMCYSEFNDIIESIAALDADVISIECSRSKMELLDVFDKFNYPNEIGPGVYDIHSPLVPPSIEMEELLEKAAKRIPAERLWVNPDCGLKTRAWPETTAALKNMVAAAITMRQKHSA